MTEAYDCIVCGHSFKQPPRVGCSCCESNIEREGPAHLRAKKRLYDLIAATGPKLIEKEYVYTNSLDPQYPWKFDIYAELWDGRKLAIEVDGKIGHSSRRAYEKRRVKKLYLQTYGIELYGFPTQWLVSRKPLGDSLFLEELGLLLE